MMISRLSSFFSHKILRGTAFTFLVLGTLASFVWRHVWWIFILNGLLSLFLVGAFCLRLKKVWEERRRGLVGARLHLRILGTFSLLAVAPAVFMAIFSALFMHLGMQAWFNQNVQTAIRESQNIARAYLDEHKKVIEQNVRLMAQDVEENFHKVSHSEQEFNEFLTVIAGMRSINEAILFEVGGKLLARSFFSSSLEFENISDLMLEQMKYGSILIYPSKQKDRVIAIAPVMPQRNIYLIVSRQVDQKVLERIAFTHKAVGAYEKILKERSLLSMQFILIFCCITALMLLLALWRGLSFSSQLMAPIRALSAAAQKIAAGDLTVKVPPQGIEDLEGLIRTFNTMTSELYSQQRQLLEAHQELARRNFLIENVLEGVSSGVIGLDRQGHITLLNTRAQRLLGVEKESFVGRTLGELAPEVQEALLAFPHHSTLRQQLALERDGQIYTLNLSMSKQKSEQEKEGDETVLTLDDVTELLSAQRKAAWSDVAQRIAHEIRNPLTPIQLSAERIRKKYTPQIKQEPEIFQQCLEAIIRQVSHIDYLIQEFSSFARMPLPVKEEVDLYKLAQEAIVIHRPGNPDITFKLEGPSPCRFFCDPQNMTQVFNNLLKNGVESIQERLKVAGQPQGALTVTLGKDEQDHALRIAVTDNGLGWPDGMKERILDPYVTTKDEGTGLGLAIVKKIIEDHGGVLLMGTDDQSSGARIELVFKEG